jgi:polyisoprenoid-binding protein YceI
MYEKSSVPLRKRVKPLLARAVCITIGLLTIFPNASAQIRAIDAAHSSITVRVFKAGVFSAFGHNHEIAAPVAQGSVDAKEQRVSLRVDATKLQVLDPEVSANTRAQIEKTMQGPAVLDSARFPEVSFISTSISAAGDQRWAITGNLTLHGQTKPVRVEVSLRDGHYRGSASIKQTDFGITPVTVAGGAVKVKDLVRIEFDIVLSQ